MSDNEWANNLKPGDPVFVETDGGCRANINLLSFCTVDHITKTMIFVARKNGLQKFNRVTLEETNRKSGRMYYGTPYDTLVEHTPISKHNYDLQKMRNTTSKIIKWLSEIKLDQVSEETLIKYYAILEQFKLEKQETEKVQP
jgi:hypothetical protein